MNHLKKGLLLLGSFSIAFIAAEALHELGHAGVAWLTGGEVFGITVSPFSWSYSYSHSPYPMLHTFAGAVGSSLVAVLLFVVLYRWTKVWMLPILLIAPITLINNGDYYLVDAIFRVGGDACSLMEMGVSIYIILSLGILFLAVGLFLAFLLVRRLGILNTPLKNRILIFTIGIISYLAMMLVWNFIYNRGEIITWLAFACTGTGVTIFFAILPVWVCTKGTTKEAVIRWMHVIVINSIAITIIMCLLFIPFFGNTGRSPWGALYDIEPFPEPPEGCPPILEPHPDASDVSFTLYRLKSGNYTLYSLTYRLPSSITQRMIRQFITNLYGKHHYTLLKHKLSDPNEIADTSWHELSSKYVENPNPCMTYGERWLNFLPATSFSELDVMGPLKDEDIAFFIICQSATENISIPKFHNYISRHPEEFDPTQIEEFGRMYKEYETNRNK